MILIHLFTGALCAGLVFLIFLYARSRDIRFNAFSWFLIIAEVLYLAFIIEMTAGFIDEGAPRAALVMGSVSGFVAVIGAVLIARFIIFKSSSSRTYETE